MTETENKQTTVPVDSSSKEESIIQMTEANDKQVKQEVEEDEFKDAMDDFKPVTAVVTEKEPVVEENLNSDNVVAENDAKEAVHEQEPVLEEKQGDLVTEIVTEQDKGDEEVKEKEVKVESEETKSSGDDKEKNDKDTDTEKAKEVEETKEVDDTENQENIHAASAPNSPRPTPLDQVIQVPADKNMADYVSPPTPGTSPSNSTRSSHEKEETKAKQEDIKEFDINNIEPSPTNKISLNMIDFEAVKPNFLTPRAQEKFDEEMITGMNLFFDNKFSQAKTLFERRSKEDPLYSLGLSSMSFIKAISSYNPKDVEAALSQLTETYLFANAQIERLSAKKPITDKVSHYFTNLMGTNTTHLPTNTRPYNKWELHENEFMPNGALRAHVIKAESSLLMAIIYLSMETVVGYIKAGLNLRRAYSSYSLVWQEYKRMGQHFMKYIDKNTVSAIQFGIGSVHLLLSALPPKILKIVSAFGWTADKQLGYALLKLCLEGKCIRSPLASLMLLSYYVLLTSYAPQVLTKELIQPAIECLLEAQKDYPNSAFFLYYAGRVSRLARNTPLSTQSFAYTFEVSQGDWAETTIGNLATFEIAFNAAMELDWSSAAVRILELHSKYNSPAFLKFFYGACMEMMGNRTEAILAFAEAPGLIDKSRNSEPEMYVKNRVAFFEVSGYQDLDFSLPALEILLTWNAFPCMSDAMLEKCLELIDGTLEKIYEREKLEYDLRKVELVPSSAAPDYYDQRAILLLMKSSVLNALHRFNEGIVHVNWLIDNKDRIKHTDWIIPFAYWESGNICWGTEQYKRARALWEHNLTLTHHIFEYRLAIRLNLAIQHAKELGVPATPVSKPDKGKTSHGRKRMSIVSSKLTGSIVSSSS